MTTTIEQQEANQIARPKLARNNTWRITPLHAASSFLF
jgi:hypothetical protein